MNNVDFLLCFPVLASPKSKDKEEPESLSGAVWRVADVYLPMFNHFDTICTELSELKIPLIPEL
jgi:hypothetical protein